MLLVQFWSHVIVFFILIVRKIPRKKYLSSFKAAFTWRIYRDRNIEFRPLLLLFTSELIKTKKGWTLIEISYLWCLVFVLLYWDDVLILLLLHQNTARPQGVRFDWTVIVNINNSHPDEINYLSSLRTAFHLRNMRICIEISHWNLSAVRLRQNILIFALLDIFEHTELLCLDNINVSNEWLWVEGGDGGDVWTLSVTTSNSSGGTLVARWRTPPRTPSWLLTSVLSQSEPRYHTAIKCWCSL